MNPDFLVIASTDPLGHGGAEGASALALDLAPAFATESDPPRLWVAIDDAHPNDTAHSLIADYSQAFIAKELSW